MTSTTEDKPTYTEAVELLTGHDELAIEKRFGVDLDSLRLSMQLRALIYVRLTAAGKTDRDAYAEAMNVTVKQLDDWFSADEDEPMPDEPVTAMGEGSDSAD